MRFIKRKLTQTRLYRITCSTISNIPYKLIFPTKFNGLHHGLVYPSPWSCITFTIVLYILHHGLVYPSPWSCISFDLRVLSISLVSSNFSDKFTFFQVSEWLFLNTKCIQDWAYISFSYKSWFHFDNSDCLARVHRCARHTCYSESNIRLN